MAKRADLFVTRRVTDVRRLGILRWAVSSALSSTLPTIYVICREAQYCRQIRTRNLMHAPPRPPARPLPRHADKSPIRIQTRLVYADSDATGIPNAEQGPILYVFIIPVACPSPPLLAPAPGHRTSTQYSIRGSARAIHAHVVVHLVAMLHAPSISTSSYANLTLLQHGSSPDSAPALQRPAAPHAQSIDKKRASPHLAPPRTAPA